MDSSIFQSSNEIRLQFTQAMSEMYQGEVPLYKKLLSLADQVNQNFIKESSTLTSVESQLLNLEHHGAIRLGRASELSMMRRLFAVMGMYAVDYYDLSVAGIPVHSTAFRALKADDLKISPFRIFCSLLRLDLIEDKQLREQTNEILQKRQIFPKELLKLVELSENQGGLSSEDATKFIKNALDIFRWHQHSTVDKQTYIELKKTHGLIADIVSFKGPHINHLTPKVLDIDACQNQLTQNKIKAKASVEGPPKRNCPILLRQTSFLATEEKIIFSNNQTGTHTARFGEVEERGIALTPKGRELYDKLLLKAKNANQEITYEIRLQNAFKEFPDTYKELHQQELAYFTYSVNKQQDMNLESKDIESLVHEEIISITPMIYEDFLPVSAAGIFSSNLAEKSDQGVNLKVVQPSSEQKNMRECFENALGSKIMNSFELYEQAEKKSLNKVLKTLSIDN